MRITWHWKERVRLKGVNMVFWPKTLRGEKNQIILRGEKIRFNQESGKWRVGNDKDEKKRKWSVKGKTRKQMSFYVKDSEIKRDFFYTNHHMFVLLFTKRNVLIPIILIVLFLVLLFIYFKNSRMCFLKMFLMIWCKRNKISNWSCT